MSNAPRAQRRKPGGQPGHKNSIRSGLLTPELAPLAHAAGADGRKLIGATVKQLLADALVPLAPGHSPAATAARVAARVGTIERVAAALRGASAQPARLPALDFETVVERLGPLWRDTRREPEYIALAAEILLRRRQRMRRGRHLVGHVAAVPGAGARPGNSSAMRNGRASERLAPLMRALGRESRLVVRRAIARASDDALAGVVLRFVHHQKIERGLRVWARDFAWRRVITLLADAEWYPADIVDPLPDALAASRRRRAQDAAVAAELERILAPVFTGTVMDALVVPLPGEGRGG